MGPIDDETLTPRERRARDAVRALPHAHIDTGFATRLGKAFAAGELADGPLSSLPEAPPVFDSESSEAVSARARDVPVGLESGEPRRRTAAVIPLPARRRGAWGWATAAAAVAAVILMANAMNRAPDWQVSEVKGLGMVIVEGRPIPLKHADEIQDAMRRGGRLVVGAGSMMLIAPGQLAIEITPGTEVVLPAAPRPLWGRAMAARLESGEIRITTGRRFHGATLAITTPEARLEVAGTTLAVIREPQGTCVCVLEGSVMVGSLDSPMEPVEHMHRRYVFASDRAVQDAAIRDPEIARLGALRDTRRPQIEGAK